MFISETQVVLPLLNDNHIEVVDIHTGSVTRLTLPPKYAKKGGFVESVRVPPLAEFWVSQMMASAVHRFDTATLQYKDSIDLKGKWTKVLAYDSARNTVYASNWTSSDISVIPLTTLKEEHRIKMNGVPRGMAFSKDGEYMVAAIFGGKNDSDSSGRAVKIDLAKEKILQTIIPGGAQRHVVRLKEGENRFAVSDMARSRVFFIDDYKKSDEIKVYNNPNTIVESPDGKFLYVSCRGRNNPKSYLLKGFDFGRLLVIDLITRQIVESIEAGNQPTGLDVSPSGRYVALTDFLDHAIRVYERVL
ncbi:MAG TPA: YncE family protein [Turneriella sp.]|nr:YncE family protein [Turneriella sp.]